MTPSTDAVSALPEYAWTPINTDAAFAARDGAGALTFKGAMYLLGGWNPGDKVHFPDVCNSEVWRSTDGKTWDLLVKKAPWEGRHTAGYVVHRGRMWIVGGDCIMGHYQPDVWSSDDGVNWRCESDNTPWGQRCLHYTVAFDDHIWIMGGQTLPPFTPSEEHFYNDVWRSKDGRDWECVSQTSPWSVRGMIGGTTVWRDRIWLLGGGTYDTPKRPSRLFYNEVWSTADGKTWNQHADAAWSPRQYHDVAVWDDRLWVMEGYHQDGGNRKDVWWSADGETWHEVKDTPWAPRHAASPYVYDGSLWMVAGNNMTPDSWRLDRRS